VRKNHVGGLCRDNPILAQTQEGVKGFRALLEFINLLDIVGNEPAFETGLLLAGAVDPNDVRRQLSHWTKA
jgi:hypothetical protein